MRARHPALYFLAAFGAAAVATGLSAESRLGISESVLGTLPAGFDLKTLSADQTASHLLWTVRDGKTRRVVYDGTPGPPFDDVEGTVLSAEGGRYAYMGKRAKQWVAVIDGHESGPYGRGAISFSPDGRRVGNRIDVGDGEYRVVVDAVEYGPYRRSAWFPLPAPVVFSSDGRHFASRVGIKENGATLECVMVDGKCGRRVKVVGRPRFSADGLHVAYWARPARELGLQLIVDDEVVGRSHEGSDEWLVTLDRTLEDYDLPFAPDRDHLAYVTTTAEGHVQLVVNGTSDPPFDRLGGVAFSHDGSHYAYVGTREKKGSKWLLLPQLASAIVTAGASAYMLPGRLYGHRVVRDGVERVDYAAPLEWYTDEYSARISLVFTADGRLAYSTGRAMAIDGIEGPSFGGVPGSSIVLAPDGRRLAYFAYRKNKWVTVVDGTEGPAYAQTSCVELAAHRQCGPSFTPDGRHVVIAVADKRRIRIAVPGCGETPAYRAVVRAHFTAASQMTLIGVRDTTVVRVTIDTAGCPPR